MPKKYPEVKRGVELDLGAFGISATQWEGADDIGADFSDCTVAIDPCGEDVFELWFHVDGRQSVCLLADNAAFSKLGRALACLIDSRAIVNTREGG